MAEQFNYKDIKEKYGSEGYEENQQGWRIIEEIGKI